MVYFLVISNFKKYYLLIIKRQKTKKIMKKIQQFLEEGKIDIALALSISLQEPKRTLALNIILARCVSDFDFSRSLKAAGFLGRDLNNFELKIIFRGILSKNYPNLDLAKQTALKMTEPDKSDALAIVFNYYALSIFSNNRYEDESKIFDLTSSMIELERLKFLTKMLDYYLSKTCCVERVKQTAEALGRELTQSEISNYFTLSFNEFAKRGDNYQVLYYEMVAMINLSNKANKAKFLSLLLGACIKKNVIAFILEISEELIEPEKTAALSIVFNYYLSKKEDKKAMETADKMSEPQRSVLLQNFMESYIQDGAHNSVKNVAAIMGRKVEQRELYRTVNRLADKGKFENVLDMISEIQDYQSRDILLKRIFNGFIHLGHYGLALKAVKVFSDREEQFKLAETLFNHVIVSDRWLAETKEVADLMSEPEKSAALIKVSSRYINEGDPADLVSLFGDKGLSEKEFRQFLKRAGNKEIIMPHILRNCSILNKTQKKDYLGILFSQALNRKFFGVASEIIEHMTGSEKENAAKNLRNKLVNLGEFNQAKALMEHWKGQLSESELNILLKKRIQAGCYAHANEIATLLGTKLSQHDLETIMQFCLKVGHQDLAAEVARKIIG